MRGLLITLLILVSLYNTSTSALALGADDTMNAWKHSSEKERSELLNQLFKDRTFEKSGLLKCMDETSKTPGHTDLSIGDVAKVCASAGNVDQPV